MIYWDTSAILPLYVEEPTTSFWESELRTWDGERRTSTLVITEFNFALHQKVLRRNLTAKSADQLAAKFAEDWVSGHWKLYPLGSDVIDASLAVAKACYQSKKPVALRSLDGLHLGAARVLRCDTVATGDERLATAAERTGLQVLRPG